MKYGIFSDVHGNLPALEKVLSKLKSLGAEKFACGGDIVGYGAEPEKCIEIVKSLDCVTVAGNHDWAVVNLINPDLFNIYARSAVFWTQEKLNADDLDYLKNLPLRANLNLFEVSHGTVNAPENFDYIQSLEDAQLSFDEMETNLCFLGHSHVPISFFEIDNSVSYSLETKIVIDSNIKTLINVGSVGQPRDENHLASCAIYDTDKKEVHIHRVEYDIDKAAKAIIDAKLPKILAFRLYEGK
ncbi:MAG: metallophosphatase family protein [Planctomycetota bacterium]|nr:MAG: metallophosphatase family protein [Planctomycetota bacterium]